MSLVWFGLAFLVFVEISAEAEAAEAVGEEEEYGSDTPMTTAGFFGGDMADFDPETDEGRNAIRNRQGIWPQGVIPYVIDDSLLNSTELIKQAMEYYHAHTCIKFRPRKNEDDYIFLTKNTGCWSSVGRQRGRQAVSLDRGCQYLGTILHELMHAAGFWHEQNRPDRDDWVTVFYENIAEGQELNFVKFDVKQVDMLGVNYDYKSVMHYGEYSFSKDGRKPTMLPKEKGVRIGDVWEKKSLSETDVQRIKILYGCVVQNGTQSV